MTFSVLLSDPTTGEIGGGVASKFLAVGSLVLHAQATVGVVATQALVNVSFGPRGLLLLERGMQSSAIVNMLVAQDELPERRQVAVLAADGAGAVHTGTQCQSWAGHLIGTGFVCQGNILSSPEVIEAIAAVAAAHPPGTPVAGTIVAALRAGDSVGGDRRGRQSAAVLTVRRGGGYGATCDTLVDLRVDDHPQPVHELDRLLGLHKEIFSRPSERDLVPLAGETLATVAAQLALVTGESFDHSGPSTVWQVLDRWAGRENLEERLIRPGAVDPVLLKALERAAAGAAPRAPRGSAVDR